VYPGLTVVANIQKTYSVLVVDDSEDDRLFLRRAVAQFPRFKIVHELEDGVDAVAYLQAEGPYHDRRRYPLPDLVLLDLKMPLMTGYDVLRWLQSQCFPSIMVLVLSGSDLQQDVDISLALGAHGYWTKTASPEKQRLIALEIEALLDSRAAFVQHARVLEA